MTTAASCSEIVRAARRARGWTQEFLAEAAELHVRTIRGIETGEIRHPRSSTLRNLCSALALDEASREELHDACGRREPGERPDGLVFAQSPSSADRIKALSRSAQAATGSVGLSERAWIDARGRVVRERSEDVSFALRDGVDRKLIFCQPDPDMDLSQTSVSSLEHCGVGRIWNFPDAHLKVFEFLFGRLLARGETHLFRYEMIHGPREPMARARPGYLIRGFQRAVTYYTLEVRFDPAVLPGWCQQVVQTRPDRGVRVVREVATTDSATHICVSGRVTGGHGVRWGMPDQQSPNRWNRG